MLYGVDVHDGYQAGLSFATLKQQGYSFAAVKFTQGTSFARDQSDEWFGRARAAGLIPGAYHWLNAEPGAAQARWFWRKLQEVGGPEGVLVQCDNEDNATWQVTKDWAAEWVQLSGGHPFLMYTGAWWWEPRGWPGVTLTPWLWHAQYLSADADSIPDDPAAFAARIPASWWTPGYGGWPAATLIQFTSRGDAGGLANNVDLNVTKLTRERLLALTTAGGTDVDTRQDALLYNASSIVAQMARMADTAPVKRPDGSFGDPLNLALVGEVKGHSAALKAIAAKVDISPEELAQIMAAAEAGAAQGAVGAADEIAAAVVALLPPDEELTQADVEAALRTVFADAATTGT